jgi:exopolysaccharide production protein ExoQ
MTDESTRPRWSFMALDRSSGAKTRWSQLATGTFTALVAAVLVLTTNAFLSQFWAENTSAGFIVYRAITIVLAVVLIVPHVTKAARFFFGEITLVLFVAWSAVTLIWTSDAFETIGFVVQLGAMLCVGVSMILVLGVERSLLLISLVLTALSLISLILVIVVPDVGTVVVQHPDEGLAAQGVGVFDWNSELGTCAAFGATSCLIVLWTRRWLVFIVGIIVNIAALLASDSATALVAMVAGVGTTILIALRRIGLYSFLGGILILALAALLWQQKLGELLFQLVGRSSNLTGRDVIWSATIGEIAKRPILGHGAGVSAEYEVLIGRDVGHAHNGFLEVAFDRGLVGIFLVAVMLLVATIRLVRGGGAKAICVAPILVSACVANLANNYLASASLAAFLFYWAIAAAYSPSGTRRISERWRGIFGGRDVASTTSSDGGTN